MKHLTTYPLTEREISLSGEYWFGDPCYVFPDDEWQQLCKLMFPNHNEPDFDDKYQIRVVNVNGVHCYLFGTAYGDGSYDLKDSGEDIAELGVDAGMLSMIPIELVNAKGWGETKWAGHVLKLEPGKKLIGVDFGDFFFGTLSINTSGKGENEFYCDVCGNEMTEDEWNDGTGVCSNCQ